MKVCLIMMTCLAVITGCGDNYPNNGQLSLKGSILGLQVVGHQGTVYRMDKNQFSRWKKTIDDANLDNLSQERLLSLREQFIQSSMINTAFSNQPLLTANPFNLTDHVDNEYAAIEDQRQTLSDQISQEQKSLNELESIFSQSKNAKSELRRIAAEYIARKKALKTDVLEKIEIAKQSFSTLRLSPKEIKSLQFNLGYRRGLNNFELDDHTMSCKQRLKGTYRARHHAEHYIYAEPIAINNIVHCAYYKTGGQIAKIKKKMRAAFQAEHETQVKAAAIAKLKEIILGNTLAKKASTVKQDHPSLVKQSKMVTYEHRNTYSKAKKNIARLKQKLIELQGINRKYIADEMTKKLHSLLKQAQPYYRLETLQDYLEIESKIQPDGSFTLDSGEDFYLISIQPSKRNRPSSIKFGVIRMQKFKDKETAVLPVSQLFSFNQLTDITL